MATKKRTPKSERSYPEGSWKPPQSFLLFEQEWATQFTGEMDPDTVGLCVGKVATVFLSATQGDELQGATWLHEVLHAIFQESGLRDVDKLSEYEEAIVTALSTQLWALLRRNKLRFD